ncbi:hypothetical protein ACJX0J_009082, partial [Zea mays]
RRRRRAVRRLPAPLLRRRRPGRGPLRRARARRVRIRHRARKDRLPQARHGREGNRERDPRAARRRRRR